MIKHLAGGAVINYGPTLPSSAEAIDGSLFYKSTGADTGLYLFSFTQDSSTTIVGDQVAQNWTAVASPSLFVSKKGDEMTGALTVSTPNVGTFGSGAGSIILNNTTGTTNSRAGAIQWVFTGSTNVSAQIDTVVGATNSKGTLSFSTRGTSGIIAERMKIDETGVYIGTGKVWHSENDGAGSGLDADLLDGQSSAFFQNASNITAGTLDVSRLPFTPVQQGGGGNQTGSKVYIGWLNTAQLGLQVDTTNFGSSWPISVSGSSSTSNYSNTSGTATNATDATSARYLRAGAGAAATNMAFNWEARPGTPTYVWGSDGVANHYVWSPSTMTVGAATNATNASNASNATFLRQGGNAGGTAMSFHWSGQDVNPTWIWGGSDGVNHYVYSPFRVVNAATSGSYGWTGVNNFYSNQNTGGSGQAAIIASADLVGRGGIIKFSNLSQAVNVGMDSDNVFRIGGHSWGANRMQLDASGNVTFSGNVTAFSDARLKSDVVLISSALDKVDALRGVTFTQTESEQRSTGLIAQELQLVLPEAVHENEDGYLSVAYGNLAGLFVEAIKELRAEITDLKAQLGK